MENKKTKIVETTTYQPVSLEEKRSWASIMFVWMGSTICVPALMVGGMIGIGMPFSQAILAMIAGFALVCIYTVSYTHLDVYKRQVRKKVALTP